MKHKIILGVKGIELWKKLIKEECDKYNIDEKKTMQDKRM